MTEPIHRTWADTALDECMTLYDHPLPLWVEHEAVDTCREIALHGDGPPTVRYEGMDGSAVIRYGWDVWIGYTSVEKE